MKTRDITQAQIEEYNTRLGTYRKTSKTFPEFFAGMSEILKDMFDVKMKIHSVPSRIEYKSSSHDSPIGRPQAWTKEQKEDPEIPNEYIAVNGVLVGETIVPDDFEYEKSEFESMRLFWSFGVLDNEFLHGTPNGSNYKWNGNTETFSIVFKLFLEDFPVMYREYRLDDNVERCNTELSTALKNYKMYTVKAISDRKNEDLVLLEIQEQFEKLSESKQILEDLKSQRNKYITDQVYQNLAALPKITNDYLDLTNYEDMKKTYKTADIPKPGSEEIFEKVTRSLERFNTYKDEYAEDFL